MKSGGGGGGGGKSKKEKKSCTLVAFDPIPHISNGAFLSKILAGTSFLSRLTAPTLQWHRPSLKQLIGR